MFFIVCNKSPQKFVTTLTAIMMFVICVMEKYTEERNNGR